MLIILFFLPLHLCAQDITGLWTGFLQTGEIKLPYEIVISETGEEMSGYSLTVFMVNDVENIGIKSIILKNRRGNITVEDKELVYNNYTTPPKRVKQYDYLVLKIEDSTMTLTGTFRTRSMETRVYTGAIKLKKANINSPSKLISKLDEINLLNSLSFIQPKTKNSKNIEVLPVASAQISIPLQIENQKEINATTFQDEKPPPLIQKLSKEKDISPGVPNKTVNISGASQPKLPEVVVTSTPAIKKSSPVIIKEKEKSAEISKSIADKKVLVSSTPKPISITATPDAVKLIPLMASNVGAAELAKRKIETIRSVFVKSDSLLLSLYDNGEIDGDTVSVLLNGKIFLSKQGLSTTAIKKTIYLTPDLGDSIQVIMYAENLGNIPPNTGLLILQDGEDRYEIRFAGDLQKNSAIILKRKHHSQF